MKKFLPLVLTCLAVFACQKENNDPQIPADSNAHYLGKQTLHPLSMSAIDLSAIPQLSDQDFPFGFIVKKETYEKGFLSADTVQVTGEFGSLFFLVPENTSGEYVLHIPSAVKKEYLKLDLLIQPLPPVPNPEIYLKEIMDNLFTPETELLEIADAVKDMPFPRNAWKDINKLKYYANHARNLIDVCTPQEKAIVVKYIQANEQLFAPLINPIELIDSTNISRSTNPSFNDGAKNFVESSNRLALASALAGSILLFTVPGLAIKALGGALVVFALYTHCDMVRVLIDKILCAIGVFVKEILPGVQGEQILSRNGLEFKSDKNFVLVTFAEWRTIYKGDLTSKEPIVVSFIQALDLNRSIWNSLQSISSNIFEGELPHIHILDDSKVKNLGEGATHLDVEYNGNNPLVTLKNTSVANNQLVVAFSTDATTTQDFTFDLVYDDGETQMKKTIQAKVIPPRVPQVQTIPASNITASSAQTGGNVTGDGGAAVAVRGVCWSTSPGPTITNSISQSGSGTGSFSSTITGLTDNTKYYVRAFGTNDNGTGYGDEVTFTTLTGCGEPPKILSFTSSCQNNRVTTEITFIDSDGPGIETYAQVTEWVIPYGQFYDGQWHVTGNFINASLKSGTKSDGVLVVTEVFTVSCVQTSQNPVYIEYPTRLALTDKCGNKTDWIYFTASYWYH